MSKLLCSLLAFVAVSSFAELQVYPPISPEPTKSTARSQADVRLSEPPAPPVPVVPLSLEKKSPAAKKVGEKKVRAAYPLPGVGAIPGAQAQLKANVIRVSSDRTEMVYISSVHANRVSTPFAVPRVIDTNEADVKIEGQSIYVTPKGETPVAMYITGDRPNDPVVSMTLVPKALPPQTIILQLDPIPTADGVSGSALPGSVDAYPIEEAPTSSAYEERLRYILRSVANGTAPDGFTKGRLPDALGRLGKLVVVPIQRFSGVELDVYEYRVENNSGETIELEEATFGRDPATRAVALLPYSKVKTGESTRVFVIADKRVK